MRPAEVEVAAEVSELLSDKQIETVELQVGTGEANCLHCDLPIDPQSSAASLLLFVDPSSRRAAARVCHRSCGGSTVEQRSLPGPPSAHLAERWASFVLPGAPLLVLQASAAAWTDEGAPALIRMLERLGFGPAREGLDSNLYATGVGEPPRARGVSLGWSEGDLQISLDDGAVLEQLPAPLEPVLVDSIEASGGALVVLGEALGLPTEGGVGFDEVLPAMVDRGVGAFISINRET